MTEQTSTEEIIVALGGRASKVAPEPKPLGLHAKLSLVMGELGFIEFDGKNKNQNYGYASAAGVLRKINTAFSKYGLSMVSNPTLLTHDTAENGWTLAVVKESVTVGDAETETFTTFHGVGSGRDKGDKAVMKASTAAYKYAFAHAFALGWGAEDPEKESGEAPRKRKSKGITPEVKAIMEMLKAGEATEELRALIRSQGGSDKYEQMKTMFRENEEKSK